MKKLLFSLLFVTGIIIFIEGGSAQASVRYGYQRPFSFYYPYNYQFYTPHRDPFDADSSCYWRYENGSYIYFCN